MSSACPQCGAAVPPGTSRCPRCGAHIEGPTKAVDQLFDDLDDLSRTADAVSVEEERVVEAAIGELEKVQRDIGRVEPRHADLRDFVKRVEASGPNATHSRMGHPPPRNRIASPIVALGVILAAGGLFLVPSALPAGLVVMFAGFALLGMGSVLYGSRRVPQ